jgi:hypothetical protein
VFEDCTPRNEASKGRGGNERAVKNTWAQKEGVIIAPELWYED